MKKYYHAYNERYKQVHEKGILWFSSDHTPEVHDWIEYYGISKYSNICEIGCGEGRDAISLAEKGFNITAVDISKEAIKKCKELSREKSIEVNWIVSDAIDLQKDVNMKFDYIYSIGTLHMLVEG
ncbi:class I SAM-dependent methyltransferase [Clostridiaceae bacterium M8S5]|nr:class I SAM-dependent methyltransferase [Clostridiaceae bacterium M8S5]